MSFTEAAGRVLKKGYSRRQNRHDIRALLLAEDLYSKSYEVYGKDVYRSPRPFHYCNSSRVSPLPKAHNPSSYTMHEGLLRIPAVQRTRWLTREACATRGQGEVAAHTGDDYSEDIDWELRLKMHIQDCESYYSSISKAGGRNSCEARMALQEVYIAAIQSLVKSERARGSPRGGDGLAVEGAIYYLKRMLTSPTLAFSTTNDNDRKGNKGMEQTRRERRAREAFDLVLQVTMKQGGLRAASLIREMRAMLAQYESDRSLTEDLDVSKIKFEEDKDKALYKEWIPSDEKY